MHVSIFFSLLFYEIKKIQSFLSVTDVIVPVTRAVINLLMLRWFIWQGDRLRKFLLHNPDETCFDFTSIIVFER